MAGRQGVFAPAFRNPNKNWPFHHNSYDASELAFLDSFVRFRPFASVFVFCQRNDTRDDTRRKGLSSFLVSECFGESSVSPQSVHSNESLHARSSGGVKRVTQVLRDEGRQSEALIQLADENQPSVRRDPIP